MESKQVLESNQMYLYKRLSVVCVMIAVSIVFGCRNKRSKTFHFVLPNHFRGAIVIYMEQEDGIEVVEKDEEIRFEIPISGVLRLKGKVPFHIWHGTRASFANGSPIPVTTDGASLNHSQVAFWHGGHRSNGMLYDFIGTTEEAKEFRRKTASGDICPGGLVEP